MDFFTDRKNIVSEKSYPDFTGPRVWKTSQIRTSSNCIISMHLVLIGSEFWAYSLSLNGTPRGQRMVVNSNVWLWTVMSVQKQIHCYCLLTHSITITIRSNREYQTRKENGCLSVSLLTESIFPSDWPHPCSQSWYLILVRIREVFQTRGPVKSG